MDEDKIWAVVGTVVSFAVAKAVGKAVSKSWEKSRGHVPGDTDDDVSVKEAVAFALVTGAAVGIGRWVANRAIEQARSKRDGSASPAVT